jgi:hypothetical protein
MTIYKCKEELRKSVAPLSLAERGFYDSELLTPLCLNGAALICFAPVQPRLRALQRALPPIQALGIFIMSLRFMIVVLCEIFEDP